MTTDSGICKIGILAFVISLYALSAIPDSLDSSVWQNYTNTSVATKVNKSGDTMTGGLTISGSVNALTLNRAGYVSIVSNNSLYIRSGNGLTYFNGAGQNNNFYAYDYLTDPTGCQYVAMTGHGFTTYRNCTAALSISSTSNSYMNVSYNLSIGKQVSTARLDVNGTFRVNGTVRFDTLNATGARAVCVYAGGILSISTNASSSYLTC